MASPLRDLAESWRVRLQGQDRLLRQSLTRQWMQMESDLDAEIAAYVYAPENERESRGKTLARDAQEQVSAAVGMAGRTIMLMGTQFASLGQRAGQEFLRLQGLSPRAAYVAPGWNKDWEASLRQAEVLSMAGLVAAMLNAPNSATSVRALQIGMSKGFARIMMIARDYPMAEFRQQIGAYEAPGGWLRLSARAQTTCMACILLDGTVYTSLADFRDHPHGMCFPIPLSATTKVDQKGIDWFLSLGKEEQERLMGVEYYAAWKAGQFDLFDLILLTAAGYAVVKSLKKLTDEDYGEN